MANELLDVNKGVPASKAFKTWTVYLLMLSCGLNAMAANVSPYVSSYVQSLGHGAALAGIIGGLTSAGRMVYKILTGAAWDKKPQWAVLLYTCSTLIAYGVLFVTKGSSLPVVVACVSLSGATSGQSNLVATAIRNVRASGPNCHPMGFFEGALVAAPTILVVTAAFYLFLYRLQCKQFRFEEQPDEFESGEAQAVLNKRNFAITVAVFVGCIILFAVGSINYGAIARGGACILMITGCMDSKAAFHNVNWTSIVITCCSLSFATALDKSGGGEMINNAIIGRLGREMASPFWIFAVFTALAALLTSVMSNTSVVHCSHLLASPWHFVWALIRCCLSPVPLWMPPEDF